MITTFIETSPDNGFVRGFFWRSLLYLFSFLKLSRVRAGVYG
jgi:hypothetical protein